MPQGGVELPVVWGDLGRRLVETVVIDADKLLDEALKRKGYKGKTMGERLVAAQRALSNNDGVWYAHKLRNRLVHEPNVRLRRSEAKNALAGIKQGLRDLGAF